MQRYAYTKPKNICTTMRRAKKSSSLIFLFVLLSIIGVVSSQQCNGSGIFLKGSTYGDNRNLILESLPTNVTKNKGFYNSSGGEGPDRVYIMGMCIVGSEEVVCSECMKIAVEQLIYNCPNQTEAFNWVPHKTICFARYSNILFFESRADEHPHYSEHKSVGINSYFGYENDWQNKMSSMKVEAQSKNGSLSNRDYFASDDLTLKDPQALYGFMQCTPDLSPADCGKCLDDCIDDYDKEGRGWKGGIIAYPSCFFRWDLYPFIGAFNFSSPTTPEEISTTSSLQYDLKTIEAATCTFSRSNMLGQGGFGEVFKGVLQDKSEIAVKRLSKESAQRVQEFKNEIRLVAKLQHRNLVTVLGFCMEGDEKILVYEFVPNKSLDHFLFEPTKQVLLDWAKRYEIIFGTAKGILYLHHDSPLKIIHRDLKASNILLDSELKPKVADFGMARILEMDQSRADTRRVVGTHGYISPEYMMHGQFSTKSDVYSFGVLVLEIISGQRNSNFHEIDDSGKSLVTHAWKHWRNGSPLKLLDLELGRNYQSNEVIRCIHIALLCVQNDPEARPSLPTIILMLTSDSVTLPVPQSPPFEGLEMGLPPITAVPVSTSDSLINDLVPR